MADAPVRIGAAGLAPGAEAEIALRWPDAPGGELRSFARVRADRAGRIDLRTMAPDSGSYSGVDGTGLLWSMAPVHAAAPAAEADPWRAPRPLRLRAELSVAGRRVDERGVTRTLMAPGVRMEEVADSGVVARLYAPARHETPLPVVMVLSGSEGGFDDLRAAMLASHGYAALTVAYFGAPGLQEELFEVPVERIEAAVAWVRRRPELDAGRIAALGASKGAELALVAAALIPDIRAVVAYAPTDVVNQGVGGSGGSRAASSWTWRGAPIPFLVQTPPPAFQAQFRGPPPYRLRPLFEASRSDGALARAAIPVERIRGAVLLVSGEDDQLIPAAPAAEAVVRRLRDARHPYPYLHRSYPGAGHVILPPWLPTTPRGRIGPWLTGGTPAGYARADADSWALILRFLADALR
ncbi:MAG: acyl-CoA thioester hydrolase/BAAT C-terminal domain-containing protein [Longimicrobiaceae bacterium]